MPVRKKRATYADLERFRGKNVWAQILGGELVVTPAPAVRHQHVNLQLAVQLQRFNRPTGRSRPGGWRIGVEPELRLHGDVLIPDLAAWRRERLPNPADMVGIEVAPDWVCEVASPGTSAIDRSRKMPIYAREKVGHAWIVDPLLRTLEVFRLTADGWLLAQGFAARARVDAEPFAGLMLHLGRLWLED